MIKRFLSNLLLLATLCSLTGGLKIKAQEPATPEHKCESYISYEAPTCVTPGSMVYICALCGTLVTESVPTIAHDHAISEIVREATCTQAGEKAYICTVCGDRITVEIPMAEHSYGEWIIVTEPTCTQDGTEENTCSTCGNTITETIPKLEHAYSNWQTVVEPTCTKEGEEISICANCGDTLTEPIPMLEHEYNDSQIVKEPTCEKDGERSYTCTTCNESVTEPIPFLGHNFGLWQIITQPTCTQQGEQIRQCIRCDTTLRQLLERIDHSMVGGKCSICGYSEQKFEFSDVSASAYYAVAVNWAASNGITTGTSPATFSPNATCTRAQVVTFLYRAMGSPAPKRSDNPFKDVKKSDYFYNAVLWAVENGITTGTSANTFSPNAGCTRAQVVTFLHRAFDVPKATIANPFKDAKSGYYVGAVLWAVEKNITTGMSATSFAPNATCSRAQIVTFLYRAIAQQ